MKPGGWIEFQDLHMTIFCEDCTVPQDNPLVKVCTLTVEALKLLGFDSDFVYRIPHELEGAGFTNVQRKILKIPVGSWPEDKKDRYFGLMAREVLDELPHVIASKLAQNLDLPQSDVNALVSEAESAYARPEHHIYMECAVVYAQKP